MDNLAFAPELRVELQHRLASNTWQSLPPAGQRQAAVVLAVVPADDGQAAILLTRRASHLGRHGGQFALPGGRIEPGETAEVAGLRELAEEVGLDLPLSCLLGRTDDFVSRSGFHITALVAWGEAGEIEPDPGEVAAVYRVPLTDCGRPDALVRTDFFSDQTDVPALDLETVGTYVFSPTAAIIHQFAELAVHGRRTAVAHFEQPAFAWR
ncbi:MAG: CoA pyrophosphatase [Acidobacteriota bacterium]